jgi:DNA-binding NarL/FixJ family response regulator
VLDADQLASVRPFVALVDLRLPGGPDGEALRRLRARFPELPVFVMTAFPDAVPDSGHGVFSKPFDTATLLETLERVHARQGQAS